jgi:hypothetical protein
VLLISALGRALDTIRTILGAKNGVFTGACLDEIRELDGKHRGLEPRVCTRQERTIYDY